MGWGVGRQLSHRGTCSCDGCLPRVPWLVLFMLPTSSLFSWSLVSLLGTLGTLLSNPRLCRLLVWLEGGPPVELSSPLLTR